MLPISILVLFVSFGALALLLRAIERSRRGPEWETERLTSWGVPILITIFLALVCAIAAIFDLVGVEEGGLAGILALVLIGICRKPAVRLLEKWSKVEPTTTLRR